jgi:hypothetical protein
VVHLTLETVTLMRISMPNRSPGPSYPALAPLLQKFLRRVAPVQRNRKQFKRKGVDCVCCVCRYQGVDRYACMKRPYHTSGSLYHCCEICVRVEACWFSRCNAAIAEILPWAVCDSAILRKAQQKSLTVALAPREALVVQMVVRTGLAGRKM